jgi:hypothetical protein
MALRHDLTTVTIRGDRPRRRPAVALVFALALLLSPAGRQTGLAEAPLETAPVSNDPTAVTPSPAGESTAAVAEIVSTAASDAATATATSEPVESTDPAGDESTAPESTPSAGATETSAAAPASATTPTEVPTDDASSDDATPTENATATARDDKASAAALAPAGGVALAAAATPTPPLGYGLIAISLADQSGQPVAGATFRVTALPAFVATVVTDADGQAFVSVPTLSVEVRVRMQNKAPNCSPSTTPENYYFQVLPGSVVPTPFATTCGGSTPTYAATASARCATLPQPRLRVGATTAGDVGAVTIANTGTAALTYAYDLVDGRTGTVLVANAGSGSLAAGQSVTPLFGTAILASDAAGWSVQRTVVVRFLTATGGATGIGDLSPTIDCAFEPYLALALTATCPAPAPLLPGATIAVALETVNAGDAPLGAPVLAATLPGTFEAGVFSHVTAPDDFVAGALAGDLTATATGTPPAGGSGAAVYAGYAVASVAPVACPIGRAAPSASGESITLTTVGFSLADQTTTATLTIDVSNSDVAGWSVTVAAGPFVYVGPHNGGSIPNSSFAIAAAATPVADPAGQPVGGPGGPVVPAGAIGSFATARTVLVAGQYGGIGSYSQTLDLQLTVPGGSVAGTYVAELTITASAGP